MTINITRFNNCLERLSYFRQFCHVLYLQLNWVCQNDWIPSLGQSVFFTGSVLGSLGYGFLADRIGRLHVLVISNMTALVGNLFTILSTNAVIFVVSRFVAGCATDANFVMMYIIGKAILTINDIFMSIKHKFHCSHGIR